MRIKAMYFLLPIIVVLGSIMGLGMEFVFRSGAFRGKDDIDVMISITYISLIVLSLAFCIAKYIRMRKRKEVYGLYDAIVVSMMSTVTINFVFYSYVTFSASFGGFIGLFVGLTMPGYYVGLVLSFIVCLLWLKENDKIARKEIAH